MDFDKYSRIILNLAAKSNAQFIENVTHNFDILHSAIGMSTETAELIELLPLQNTSTWQDKFMYELGDLMWYITLMMRHYRVAPNIVQLDERSLSVTLNIMVVLTGKLLSIVKAKLIYDRPIEENNVIEILQRITSYIDQVAQRYLQIDLGKVMEANVKKLQKRYPQGFTQYHANARLDEDSSNS